MAPHPLDPLTAEELKAASSIIRNHAAPNGDTSVWFKYITMVEPPKVELVKYLNATRESSGTPLPTLDRVAGSLVYLRSAARGEYVEYIVSLSSSEVLKTRALKSDEHPAMDGAEIEAVEKALLANQKFKTAIAKLNLPEKAIVVADAWIYGADNFEPTTRKIPFMVYYRLLEDRDTNHYAYPLPLVPVMDSKTLELVDIEYTPIFGGDSTKTLLDLPEGESFPYDKFAPNEYAHKFQSSLIRTDLKPLEVLQKDGPSFVVDGQKVEWQKWAFRVGWNYREGVTIHDIRYDGRDVVHRLSISDMAVPYGDPRFPLHRKEAFDFGDVGAGITSNELDLGCDCLGSIHYFSTNLISAQGDVVPRKNVICLHEQDEGLLWKHTNFRTNVASVSRNRVLVIQMVITVANYEYLFAFKFDQAANIHVETRATGILSTCTIMPGESSPYGTVVNPGVLATNHQHLFSVRIDPAIGGLGEGNTVFQEDSVPMPFDIKNPPSNNQWGVGYTVEKTAITTSGWADAAPEKNRVFKIINPARKNAISGRAMGYKLVPQPSQMMLAHPDSAAFARAEFAGHHIWVTKHQDDELYSAGRYTNQSFGNAGGIKTWVGRKDSVENADLVLWHTFGITHNPRVEDWPVMPVETHSIVLKPVDFFDRSPAIDVPASTQASNKSTLVNGGTQSLQGNAKVEEAAAAQGLNGHGANGVNGANGHGANGHGVNGVNGNCCK